MQGEMPSILRALWALILTVCGGNIFRAGDNIGRPSDRFRLPDGTFPAMAGGAPEDDDDDDPDPEPDDDEDDDDEDDADPPEGFDRDRALRTIKEQRKAEREAKRLAKAEKKRADELAAQLAERQAADETEAEKIVRERDEAKADAQRARDRADKLMVDAAIREAALDADVPPKKVKRLLRLIDREGISIDNDGQVDGVDDALDDLLDEFPEFKPAATTDPEPEPDGEDGEPAVRREPPGGKPDRKRKPKELSAADVQKLLKTAEGRQQFNELFEAGKIPAKALGKA